MDEQANKETAIKTRIDLLSTALINTINQFIDNNPDITYTEINSALIYIISNNNSVELTEYIDESN